MRILVIGGTQFVGRAFVEQAARRGHEVTIFHRGRTEPDALPAVEHVHGDRRRDLGLIQGRSWDAAVDTSAYFPSEVRELGAALGNAVAHYTFVSTNAVHPVEIPQAPNEESPTRPPLFLDAGELALETYGALKVACEFEASRAFPGRSLTIRPGYLVGPHDPTDRFTWYARRAAEGGEMLSPGPPDAPFQVLDVRDLASFMVARVEAADTGVYGVVGPAARTSLREILEAARDVAGADTSFVWVTEEFLRRSGGEVSRWFPMWQPQHAGAHTYDASRAVRAGLQRRPLAETVSDTLAWDEERGSPELRSGLPSAKEQKLLAAWRGSGTSVGVTRPRE